MSNKKDKHRIKLFNNFIKDYKSKYRGFPTIKIMHDNTGIPLNFIKENGGYIKLLRKLGYSVKNYKTYNMKSVHHLKDEDFIKLFKEEWGVEKAPSPYQLKQVYKTGLFKVNYSSIRARFNQYNDFIKLCGYTEFIDDNKMDIYYKIIENKLSKYDKLPALNKFMKENKFIPMRAINYWGGYEQIINSLGYDYKTLKSNNYSKIEIIEILKPIFNKYDYINNDLISDLYNSNIIPFGEGVIKNKFGSVGKLLYEMNMLNKKHNNTLSDLTNEEIIDIFNKKFIDKTNPPTQLELVKEYDNGFLIRPSMIVGRFKSYSGFLNIAGYTNIPNGWAVKRIAKDGHMCDSKSEMKVDNFLYDNKIWHDIQPKYSDFCKLDLECIINSKRADFILKDGVIVEYFGMKGYKKYDIKIDKKIEILKRNKVNCILIYPNDLNNLNEIFKDYIVEGGDY